MAFNYSFRVAVSLAVALLAGVMWTVDVFWGALCTALLPIALYWQQKLYRHHVRKVLFMLDAIENNDNAIHFSETENTADARLVNRALNRVAHILYNVKSETAQQEKYYELILDCVNTGILVLNDNGAVYQKNSEALRLLGLNVFTHVSQLNRVDPRLSSLLANCRPGDKLQMPFNNERGTVNMSVRVSDITVRKEHLRILALNDINNELDNLGSQLSDKGSADFANNYGEVTDAFFSIADIIPDKFKGLYEMLVKLTSKANLKAYAKSLPYLAKSKRGFNLFEITDRSAANEGVTVGTVTDNGFGDPFNHGLRIFCDTDDYMVVGTANPFYGTQLWRVRNTQYAVNVSATEGGSASADVERAAKGSKVTLTATANKGYHFKEWNVLKGNVSIENNAFEMPDGSVSIQAVFEKDAVEPTTPTTPAKPATDTKPSTTPTGVTSTPSTGSSVLGMAVAAAVALIAGAAILLKKKQA